MPDATPRGAGASPLAGRRILVVDDSQTACAILRAMLERAGASVETLTDGGAAVALFRRDPEAFDVLLMDLVMEGGAGCAAIPQSAALRRDGRPPVVAMSATVEPGIVARCVALGAHGRLLRKPYRAAEVVDCLAEAMAGTAAPAPLPAAMPPSRDDATDGIDVESAVARCGGDVAMLRSLLRDLRGGLADGIAAIRSAIEAGNRRAAAAALHKLRGETLNLGLDALSADIARIEDGLRAGDPVGRLLVRLQEESRPAVDRLEAMLGERGRDAAPGMLDGAALRRLVAALAARDPTAPQFVAGAARALPEGYADAEDAKFRARVEALDFDGALAMLRPADGAAAEPGDPRRETTILIVDDHAGTVRVMARILAPVATLRFALSGEAALAMAREAPPDLVVADVNMGDMSGIDLCKAMKAGLATSDVPVILVSADQDMSTEARALTAGAVDFIEKPLSPPRVLSRVMAQLDIRRRATEIRALLSGGPAAASLGFVLCDPEGRILDLGAELAVALGLERARVVGTALADFLRAGDEPGPADEVARGLEAGSFGPVETALRGSDGRMLPVRVFGRMVTGAEGRLFWLKLDDMRDRVRLERERLEREKAAAIFSITAGIAHEFNNILGIVLGNVDSALEEIGDPASVDRRLRAVLAAAERGAAISRAMLDSASHDAGPPGTALSLEDALAAMWPVLANALPKRLRLERGAADASLRVVVDVEALRGALIALLDNAADANPGPGRVSIAVRADAESGMAAIEVADDGPGMAEDVRARAFDPFFTTRAPYRVGLGLTAVFSFALRHRGRADIASAPRAGTRVTIRLPVAPPRASSGR
ncbi:MAG: response regulator [Alphaproteobacteria bacterium]